jgi:hypothetical protein
MSVLLYIVYLEWCEFVILRDAQHDSGSNSKTYLQLQSNLCS